MNVLELLCLANSAVKGTGEVSNKVVSVRVINQFRKCNKICAITKSGEIFIVADWYNDIRHCMSASKEFGFVEVVCYNAHEVNRFISIDNIVEFTLGDLPLNSDEFLTPLEKYSKKFSASLDSVASKFGIGNREDSSESLNCPLDNSNSFR